MSTEELIKKLEDKSIGLSYSWLKNFTSPIDFLLYKQKPFKQNAGMLFGSLCDVLLLTPNELYQQFAVVDKSPTTDNQSLFCETLIRVLKSDGGYQPEDIIEAYKASYKWYEKSVADKANELNEELGEYIEATATGKMIITNELLAEAKALKKKLLSYDDVAKLFSQIETKQHKLEWIDKGWKFKGFLDFTIPDTIFDLKYSSSADPDEFVKTIYKLGYDLQAGTYIRGAMKNKMFEQPPHYFFLVYDKKGNYSIIQLDYTFVNYGTRKLDFYLENLDRMIKEKSYHESYNFFNRTATAYKPKWAKAYPLSTDEDN